MKKVVLDALARVDGFINQFTGLGIRGRDSIREGQPEALIKLTDTQIQLLLDGDSLGRKSIFLRVRAAFRNGFEITEVDDVDMSDAIATFIEDHDIVRQLFRARIYEEAYGGAAMLLGIDDGQTPDMPLNPATARRLKYIRVLPASRVRRGPLERDPESSNYRQPMYFEVQKADGEIAGQWHHSRVVSFDGPMCTTETRDELNGWGPSRFVRMYTRLQEISQALSASAGIVPKFVQTIFKVAGLREAIGAGNDDFIFNRLSNLEFGRSSINAMVLADGEEWENKTTNVSGLPDLLKMQMYFLSEVIECPVVVLFSWEPAGLNASSGTSMKLWHESVSDDVAEFCLPSMRKLFRTLFILKDGPTNGEIPVTWSIKFRPIAHLDEETQARVHLTQAQADQIYMGQGVLDALEVRDSRFNGDEYSTHTTLKDDVNPLELVAAVNEARALAAQSFESSAPDEPDPDEME